MIRRAQRLRSLWIVGAPLAAAFLFFSTSDAVSAQDLNPGPSTPDSGKARISAPGVLPTDHSGGMSLQSVGKSGKGDSANRVRLFRRPGTGVPPAGEPNYVPDEVVIELPADTTDAAAEALARRFGLARLESFNLQLTRTTLYPCPISARRTASAALP